MSEPTQESNCSDSNNFFVGGAHNIDVIAHRGGNGEWPGETLYAFHEAKERGVDVLEMDLRLTKDDQLVLMHNATVSSTTNGFFPVRCYDVKSIQELDAGYRWTRNGEMNYEFRGKNIFVPTFEQVLQEFSSMRMNIELKGWHPFKTKKIAEEFCRLIKQHHMECRVLVASFHKPVLRHIREILPEIAISASTFEVARFLVSTKWGSGNYKPGSQALQTFSSIIDDKFVNTAQRHRLKVHGWTVNDPDEMDRLIKAGVHGIITDLPSTLLKRPGV